jgi:hypothetical protein
MSTTKSAGIAGIVYAIANVLVGFSAGTPPALDDPVGDVRDFFVDHRAVLLATAVVATLTVPLIVWFVAAVARRLRATGEDLGQVGGAAVILGAAAGLALVLAANALGVALLELKPFATAAGDDTVRLVYLGTFALTFLSNAAFAAAIGAVGAAGRGGAFPSWFCTLSLVFALVLLITAAIGLSSASAGTMVGTSFVLIPLWVLIGGILMVRTPEAG